MKKILCFGDSNTWGHNPIGGPRLERPWPSILEELLPECEIIADGVCGRTTAYNVPGEYDKNGLLCLKQHIESGNGADLLIVMLGTNDTLNPFQKSAEESAQNIRECVKLWKSAFGSDVLIISPIHITDFAMKHEMFSQLYSYESINTSLNFASEYKKAADDENVHFLDASVYIQPDDADGIHLSQHSHEVLANVIAEKLRGMK